MPRVEDEDKENKDDGQSNRTNERTKKRMNERDRRSLHELIAIIPAVFSILLKYIFL